MLLSFANGSWQIKNPFSQCQKAIKVVLGNSIMSSTIFRHSAAIPTDLLLSLSIMSDKTLEQQMKYKNFRQQLLKREQAGETNIIYSLSEGYTQMLILTIRESWWCFQQYPRRVQCQQMLLLLPKCKGTK